MKRVSFSRTWMVLAVTAGIYAVTLAAGRRFPPAPAQTASVELRVRRDALKAFDAAALEKARQRRESAGASALVPARVAEIQARLADSWNTTPLPVRTAGDLSIVHLTLHRSGSREWPAVLTAIREVQDMPGVFVSAVSVSARGSVLSVELTAKLIAHSQPADDKASGLPAVVQDPQNR